MPTKPHFRTIVAQILLLRILWPLLAILRGMSEDDDAEGYKNALRFVVGAMGIVAPTLLMWGMHHMNYGSGTKRLVLSVLLYTTLCFIYGVFEKQLGGKPYQFYQDEEK